MALGKIDKKPGAGLDHDTHDYKKNPGFCGITGKFEILKEHKYAQEYGGRQRA